MATYTKETALYDTGAIANDIGEAGETASKYITAVDQNGIKVHAENNINVNYTLINAEGMEVYQGDTAADSVSVAKFGTTTRIGDNASANISIDEDSIIGVGEDGKSFFKFADSDTQLVSTLSVLAYSGRGRNFPTTAGSGRTCTLSRSPDAGSTITVRFQLRANGAASSTYSISFTQGVSGGKSKNITYPVQGTAYTLYAKYDGSTGFSNIYATPQMTAIDNVECQVRYQASSLAPSFEIGEDVAATGGYSYAEGHGTTASGNYSHAEGRNTTASGSCAHAEGYNTQAIGIYSHAEGNGTQAGKFENNTRSGSYSHAEGWNTQATNDASHAEGNTTIASGQYSHTEGANTTATAYAAHAEGGGCDALAAYSHAEGLNSETSGSYSHAEGGYTKTTASYSHAEGYTTTAGGLYSHASGNLTTANGRSQTVIGECNVPDTTSLFIIGNGSRPAFDTSTATYSNALTVDWNGNVDIASGASYKINGTSLIDIFYPIGSYYETSDTTFDPNTAWGGTWSLETEGLVHIGAGSTYTVGDTGGETEHTLTVTEMPSHTHTQESHSHKLPATVFRYIDKTANFAQGTGRKCFSEDNNLYTNTATAINKNTGGDGAHNNMQPYIVVNRWHRTA